MIFTEGIEDGCLLHHYFILTRGDFAGIKCLQYYFSLRAIICIWFMCVLRNNHKILYAEVAICNTNFSQKLQS